MLEHVNKFQVYADICGGKCLGFTTDVRIGSTRLQTATNLILSLLLKSLEVICM